MTSLPEALNTLPLPEVRRRRWLRPALVSAGLAAILALLILLPRLNYMPQRGSPVTQAPQELERVTRPPVREMQQTRHTPEIREDLPAQPASVPEHRRIARPKQPTHATEIPERPILSPSAEKHPSLDKVAEAPLEDVTPPGTQQKRILVIASRVEPPPEPSVIEIKSTDNAAGTITIYALTTDEAGDQTVEIESHTNPTDDRRMES